MNKRTIFSVLAGIALSAAGAVTANANTINGSFSISGGFTPFLSGVESSLLDANELDFNDGVSNPGTPGTNALGTANSSGTGSGRSTCSALFMNANNP